MTKNHRTSPSLLLALFEAPRALSEATALIPVHPFLSNLPPGDGHAVMTLPGFLASDRSTRILRKYLATWNYASYPWDLGRNLGMSESSDIEAILDQRVRALYDSSGGKVSLIGWSLGGLMAREIARRNPQLVRQVITMGSPLGSPKATNTWCLYQCTTGTRFRNSGDRQRLRDIRKPVEDVPGTSIYSKSDSVVAWQTARAPETDSVENIQVIASHFGMGFNPAVLYLIADRLRQEGGKWRPFEITGWRKLFYK